VADIPARGIDMNNRVITTRWLLTVAFVWLSAAVCQACPTCKDGLAGSQSAGMAEGYFWSILFMMSMPFLILGGLGTYFYLQVRAARASAAPAPEPTAAEA
jgi:hypothetical protein